MSEEKTAKNPGSYAWSTIIAEGLKGAGQGMQGASQHAQSKRELKEARRRTLARLMNSAMNRERGRYKTGQEYSDEMNDTGTQSLQHVARSFASALHGSRS